MCNEDRCARPDGEDKQQCVYEACTEQDNTFHRSCKQRILDPIVHLSGVPGGFLEWYPDLCTQHHIVVSASMRYSLI